VLFHFGKNIIEIPENHHFVYYATFIVGEYDFLKLSKDDVVLDAGAFIGDFTIKVARKVKEVVAVEPLPWAFKILKKNVEMNELKNVTLVNKALWDGQTRIRITDKGVGSSVGEGDIEVETVSVDQLGKFSIVKMDIEGAEGVVVKRDWLENVCQVAMELHGRENIEYVPQVLLKKGFKIRFMRSRDLYKNTIKNVTFHFPSFLDAEIKTKVLLNTILFRRYEVPALSNNEFRIVYGKRL